MQELGLLEDSKLKEVLKVADVAGKEFGIEQALDKMLSEWASLELSVVPYRETGTYVIKVRYRSREQYCKPWVWSRYNVGPSKPSVTSNAPLVRRHWRNRVCATAADNHIHVCRWMNLCRSCWTTTLS